MLLERLVKLNSNRAILFVLLVNLILFLFRVNVVVKEISIIWWHVNKKDGLKKVSKNQI